MPEVATKDSGSFVGNAAVSGAERLFLVGARFCELAILAHALGPEGQAVYALAISTATLATFPNWGFDLANNYFGNSERDKAPALLGNALVVASLLALVLAPALRLAFGPLSANILSVLPSSAGTWVPLVTVALLFESQFRGLVVGLGNYGARLAASVVASSIFLTGLLVTFATGRLSLDLIVPLYLAGRVGALGALTIAVARSVKARPRVDMGLLLKSARYGAGAALYRGASYLNYGLDIFILAAFLDARALGLYAFATAVITAVAYLPKGLTDVVVTLVSRQSAVRRDAESSSALVALYQFLSVFTFATSLVVAAAAPWFIPAFFTMEFAPAVQIVYLLLPGGFGGALGRVAAHHLMGRGELRFSTIVNLASLVVLLGLDLWLIPYWGTAGAAIAFSITHLLMGAVLVVAVARRLGRQPLSLLVPGRSDLRNLIGQFKTSVSRVLTHATR